MQVTIHNNLQVELPSGWTVNNEDNRITIFDQEKGVGALQLSIYKIGNPHLLNVKDELVELVYYPLSNVLVNNSCAQASHVDKEDNRYWRYWLFLKQNNLFFATYNCETSDRYIEDTIIDKMIVSFLNQ